MTYLTVPISADSIDKAKEQMLAAAEAGAQMLELRTDYSENLGVDLVRNLVADVKGAAKKRLPLIVTCRDAQQGGAINYTDGLRVDVLTTALKAGGFSS